MDAPREMIRRKSRVTESRLATSISSDNVKISVSTFNVTKGKIALLASIITARNP
jgi:hypothetical protein